MGNTADERLTNKMLRDKLGGAFRFVSEDSDEHLDLLREEADGMRGEGASEISTLPILAGVARQPYDTRKL